MPDEPVARLRPRLVYARGGGWSGAVTQARGDTSRPAAMWRAGTGFSSGAGDAGSATTVAQLIIELQFDEVPAGIGQPPPKVAVQDEWRCASWCEEAP
jgi:hypothetical protein